MLIQKCGKMADDEGEGEFEGEDEFTEER